MFGIKPKVKIVDEVPWFPEPLAYIWEAFKEISLGLQGNGWSYPIITWVEIDCWSRVTGEALAPHEARTIMTLSTMRASIMAEKAKSETNGGSS